MRTSEQFDEVLKTGCDTMKSRIYLSIMHLLRFTDYQFCRLYYQCKPDRLALCPVTIHALLHIADYIEATGPVWASWAFPMERFCGKLQPAIRSRRYPYACLDNYIVISAQLSQIKLLYGLQNELRMDSKQKEFVRGQFSHPSCMFILAVSPRSLLNIEL